jgi:eukaryotic-like serine/threonine-protein kinase
MIVPVPDRPQIEKYEVHEEIGHGGMATVYRARDKRLERDVAVKVIHRHLRESTEIAARFVSEARAVAKLKHPNIVEVYDVSEQDAEERYLVVELVRGPTLRKLLTETGHMPAEVAAAIGIEIGGALDHAHEAGVVHRDVKPENVLVEARDSPLSNRTSQERTAENSGPRIKITDFGIAKLLDAQGVTSTGQVLGSPAHMAPEQIEGGDVTARADVFGLGVLLYECMVGRLPFDGKNPAQVLRRVLDGTFTPPDRARPTIGAQLSRIIEKALSREAEGRYESARALVDALRAELERVGMNDPRRELAEYLADPKAYFVDYDQRIVERLVELGKRARVERQLPAAAAFFNRALAFRPDDTELIRQVAGLAQTERMKRFAFRAGAILGGSALLGALAFGVSRLVQQPRLVPSSEQPAVERPVTARSVPIVTNRATPPPPMVSAAPVDSAPKKVGLRPYVPSLPPPAGEQKRRAVRVTVVGATGGTVKVNSDAINWLTDRPELLLGPNLFEGVPPDEKCCKPFRALINIVPGEGPQHVTIDIPFRQATIRLAGPPGAEVRCPLFFNGPVKAGQSAAFKLQGEKTAECTILGPDPSDRPRTFPVKLSPGGSETLSY